MYAVWGIAFMSLITSGPRSAQSQESRCTRWYWPRAAIRAAERGVDGSEGLTGMCQAVWNRRVRLLIQLLVRQGPGSESGVGVDPGAAED